MKLLSTLLVRVIDGDTIRVGGERIRLRGIDTPELDEPDGLAAKQRLEDLLRSGPMDIIPHGRDVYDRIIADVFVNGTVDKIGFFTEGVNKTLTIAILNPLEAMLSNAPWYLTFSALVSIALVLGGLRAALVSAALLAGIVATGLWWNTMITFAQTLLAAALTMCVGVVLGVWIGRSAGYRSATVAPPVARIADLDANGLLIGVVGRDAELTAAVAELDALPVVKKGTFLARMIPAPAAP